ncbi:hypothetical protein [Natronoglomus mannanivorans]|uniref:DUF8160 domain-containing protein n=1 Tax=Natronoglomus mannanivorans TaxID=2979990 RepID=A0AAP2Z3C6_9EURY|nr:hypothetical protein [Halobacteria archaeon AArc-xg1-1]
MSEDRADRVSNRRKERRRSRGAEDDREEEDEPNDTEQTKQTPQATQAPVTDREHATFYLREDLRDELRRTRKQIELDLDIEYGVEPEKNRHIRPLMLYLGAKQLQDMDATEISDVLNTTDILDDLGNTEE